MRKREIVKGLNGLGLKKGDIVLLHSALSTLGRVAGGANTVVDAFIEVLAKEGTLVVPVFGKLGVITEEVKARRNSVKSIHPLKTHCLMVPRPSLRGVMPR